LTSAYKTALHLPCDVSAAQKAAVGDVRSLEPITIANRQQLLQVRKSESCWATFVVLFKKKWRKEVYTKKVQTSWEMINVGRVRPCVTLSAVP